MAERDTTEAQLPAAAAELATPARLSDRRTPTSPDPLVSLLVPAYNEDQNVEDVLRRVDALPLRTEVIAVDDGSTDRTSEVLRRWEREHGILALRHPENRGKGAAVRSAIGRSTGEIVVIQDADMEYDPAEVPTLIQPIIDGYADVVYGSRLSGGRPQRAYMFWHLVGNRILALLTNVLYNTTLTDMETGYKAFRGELIRDFDLHADDFRIEPELTSNVLRRRLRLYELPIAYYGRSYGEGKKISWRDGLPAVWTLLRLRFRRR
jgi:glycosyltransferase involved in cell wall biosynthesis